ncbi:MAG: hypothetical protein EPO27_10580 [Betaproteobacteria bacterium]|nr:MAG: hypothetical protein EPO27_10580 [Betaproteobacteria bacterium]
MAIDKQFLEANHADLVGMFRTEGKEQGLEEGRRAGAEAERARIQAVEAAALPGCEDVIKGLKFDGKTTGAEAAQQCIAHYKAQNAGALAALKSDAAALPKVPATPSASGEQLDAAAAEEAKLPLEERCKARWDRNAGQCRDEFPNVDAYTAFERANAAGRVKVLGKRAA